MSQHLETVIKSRIPGIQSLINKTIAELETELSRLGKPIAADAGVSVLCAPSVLSLSICLWSLDSLAIPLAVVDYQLLVL